MTSSDPPEPIDAALGFAKLARSVADIDALFDKPLLGAILLWVTARASASQTRRAVYASHGIVWLEPGESVTSIRTLSERFSCSRGKAARALQDLETIGVVYTKRDSSGTVIGLCNYKLLGKVSTSRGEETGQQRTTGGITPGPPAGSPPDHRRDPSKRREGRGEKEDLLAGNPAAQVLESFNQTFGRKLKIETWKRVIERALQSGKTTRELRGVIWWANGRDYYQERKAEIDPSWLFRLSSKDGRKTLPQMLELATEEWEATQGEPCPWKSE